jgi:hypothetical protein
LVLGQLGEIKERRVVRRPVEETATYIYIYIYFQFWKDKIQEKGKDVWPDVGTKIGFDYDN